MRPDGHARVLARRVGLSVCALLALLALPGAIFPWPWFVALLAPATLAIPLRRLPLRTFEQLALVTTLQVLALAMAIQFAGPLDRLAALAGTLLPPLAFLAIRAEPLDVLRGVFLSFCVLLIGTILGAPSNLHVLAFVAVAVLTLQADVAANAAEDRASARSVRPRLLQRAGTATSIASACVLACVLVFHGLEALPGPREVRTGAGPADGASRNPVVGPSSEFDFGNVQGSILSLRGNRLVRVRSTDGRAVPADLYLRGGQFDVTGLDRWGTRRERFVAMPSDAAGRTLVRRPRPGIAEQQLAIELLQTAAGIAYVPPGTFEIRGADGLLGDPRAAVFRFDDPPAPPFSYEVSWQSIRDDAVDELPDARLAGLTEISNDLRGWRGLFEEILAQPGVRREIEPMAVARAIAAELHQRCSYALREPTGRYAHSILNFLDGDRREGFCMHFASVTAICLRIAGIPARIGVGLYGGAAAEDELDARDYGSQNAHAWVEIPFADLGWVVFDPTPPAARQNLRWIDFGAGDAMIDGDAATDAAATDRGAEPRLSIRALRDGWPWIAAIVAVSALSSLRWRRSGARATAATRIPPDARTARRLLERILSRLSRQGHPRAPRETLENFARRLDERGVGGAALRDAFAAYQEIRFGGRPFDAPHRGRLEHAVGPDDA